MFSRFWTVVVEMRSDRSGTVAILFAIAAVPLLLAAGVAIDYVRASQTQAKVQVMIDAAALAAASLPGATHAERRQTALEYLEANLKDTGIEPANKPQVVVSNKSVRIQFATKLPTTLMRLASIDTMDIAALTEVGIPGAKKAEIVLVLDYSGSMNERGKYQAMRDSAIELVEALTKDASSDGTVKFGLVPFSHHVYGSLPGEYIVEGTPGMTWTNCTKDRKYPYNVNDTVPVVDNNDTKWGMTPANGYDSKAYNQCTNYAQRKLVMRPLTTEYKAVVDQLSAMRPFNLTHIALGVEFGWAMLSPTPPFTDGVPYDDKETEKFLVILTDGAQTEKAWGRAYSYTVPNGETNLEEMCRNIKKTGIKVVTVAFDLEEDKGTRSRLRNCASKPEYYFEPKRNDELALAFEQITKALMKSVHIMK